jgi:hypothetical protein
MAIEDLELYRRCPERYRRAQADPLKGLSTLEYQYRQNMRKLLVRFYTNLAEGRVTSEAELRRSWSTLWRTSPKLETREWDFHTASIVNATMTAEERMVLRGTKSLHRIVERAGTKKIIPQIVDEPYSLTLDSGLVVTGQWDLIYKDSKGAFWLTHWSDAEVKQDTRFALFYPVAALAFEQRYGARPGLLVDYILGIGDYVDPVKRTEKENQLQLSEVAGLAEAFSKELYWRSVGLDCNSCPYKAACLGVTVVQNKRVVRHPSPTTQ